MTTHEKQGDKPDAHHDAAPARPEQAAREADHHLPEMLKDQAKLREYLKAGGRSGISHDFGKPTIVDSGAQKEGGDKQAKGEQGAEAHTAAPQEAPANKPEQAAGSNKPGEALSAKDYDQMAHALASPSDSKPPAAEAKSAGTDAKAPPADTQQQYSDAPADSERSKIRLQGRVTETRDDSGGEGGSAFAQISGIEHSNGDVQIGKEHYQVKDGQLYHQHKDIFGLTHVDKEASGQLEEGGKIKFSDGKAGDLNQQDCLVRLTDANGNKHDILSAGGRQLDLDAMQDQANLRSEGAQEMQQKYHEGKPFTSDFANALAKRMGGQSLDDCVNSTTDNFNNAKKQFDKMNEDLLSGKVQGDDLGTMARRLSATSTGLEDLARDQNDVITAAKESQKIAKDFVVDSGTTIATAGVGAGLSAAMKAPEVATTLNAALKAKEGIEAAEGVEGAGKVIVNAGKGVVQGTGNVMKEYEHGKSTPADMVKEGIGGVVTEMLPTHVADGIKEKVFGEALEEAQHNMKKVAEQSNAALRYLGQEQAAKEAGTLNAAAKGTEKIAEEGTKKPLESATSSDQKAGEEKAEEAKKEAEKQEAEEKKKEIEELKGKPEGGEEGGADKAPESKNTQPPDSAKESQDKSEAQKEARKEEEKKEQSEAGN